MRWLAVAVLAFVVVAVGFHRHSTPVYQGDVYYVEDKPAALTLEQAAHLDWAHQARSPVNFGFTRSVFWICLPVTRAMLALGPQLLLEIDFPNIRTLDYFHLGNDGKVKFQTTTGTRLPFSSRPLWDTDWLFPANHLVLGDRLLLRVKSDGFLQLPLQVYPQSRYLQGYDTGLLFWGAYYGLMLIMALYSFLNSLVIRDRLYLYYGAFVMASGLVIATLNGHGFAYVWPDAPVFNALAFSFSGGLMVCFGTAFTLRYLDLILERSRFRFAGYGLIAASSVTVLLALFFHIDLALYTAGEILAFVVALATFGTLSVWKGHYLGWHFLMGWSVFLLGFGMFTLNLLGVMPFNMITVHTKEVGAALEIIMLSLGMSAIYNREREEQSRINNAIELMKSRLHHRITHVNNKSGFLEIPLLETHLQDIRALDKRIHTEMGRLLVVSVLVIDRGTQRPDYIAQGDCLRALFNSRVTVFPFKTRRDGLPGEITVLLFPLHNKFEAEPILDRVAKWKLTLGEQYDMHFGYAISHLTEKYEVDYIEESLDYLEEAVLRHLLSYSIDDVLNFVSRPGAASA